MTSRYRGLISVATSCPHLLEGFSFSSIFPSSGNFYPFSPTRPRPRAFSSSQVTQEVSHPVTNPEKASKLPSEAGTAQPKGPTTAASGDASASAPAVERPTGLRRSISQPMERGRGRAAATRKVTLFERCTTTTLESSSSSMCTDDGNDNGEKLRRRNSRQSSENMKP